MTITGSPETGWFVAEFCGRDLALGSFCQPRVSLLAVGLLQAQSIAAYRTNRGG
jgi:hypothetical protein